MDWAWLGYLPLLCVLTTSSKHLHICAEVEASDHSTQIIEPKVTSEILRGHNGKKGLPSHPESLQLLNYDFREELRSGCDMLSSCQTERCIFRSFLLLNTSQILQICFPNLHPKFARMSQGSKWKSRLIGPQEDFRVEF